MTDTSSTRPDAREYAVCRHCGYSATPNEVLGKESKHFTAHWYECVRCGYRPEAKATWEQAKAAWNSSTPAQSGLEDALNPSHRRWTERKFRNAHTIDIIVRKDAQEYRYEGDFLKGVARIIAPEISE